MRCAFLSCFAFSLLIQAVLFAASSGAQPCAPAWDLSFADPGVNGSVRAIVKRADGPGFIAGGLFLEAGAAPASRVAMWDGAAWTTLGGGFDGPVLDFFYFDDGSGEALYAAGSFSLAGGVHAENIARWDGEAWSPLGAGVDGTIVDMCAHDDGSGPALYVAGGFTNAGAVQAKRIARWNGQSWSAVGGNVPLASSTVSALAVFDPGDGPRLFAGGVFPGVDGVPAVNIAQWDGAAWSAVGAGLNGEVLALQAHDDGDSSALYAGGTFTASGSTMLNRVARWDGAEWSPLGSGITNAFGAIETFESLETADGPRLFAGGAFLTIGGVPAQYLAAWDGAAWSAVGAQANGLIATLDGFADETGAPALLVGGDFTSLAGATANRVGMRTGCAPGGVEGDLNGDGLVGSTDLANLLGSWGEPDSPADLNDDGVVNAPDLATLLGNWTTN